jgi:hypothetical protein
MRFFRQLLQGGDTALVGLWKEAKFALLSIPTSPPLGLARSLLYLGA